MCYRSGFFTDTRLKKEAVATGSQNETLFHSFSFSFLFFLAEESIKIIAGFCSLVNETHRINLQNLIPMIDGHTLYSKKAIFLNVGKKSKV